MPGSKIYIVNSVDLVASVQRLHRQLAFRPIEAKFASRLCASSKEANGILMANLGGEEGDRGHSDEVYKLMHPALAPGTGLDGLNNAAVQDIVEALDRLSPQDNGPKKIRLVRWLRHEITMATTNAVYGEHNPFKSAEVEEAFWNFERSIAVLLIDILPHLTARKGYQAREVLSKAFQGYFEAGHHEIGSMLVQGRYQSLYERKIPIQDIARYEACGSIAILLNTFPTIFWTPFYMFSRPEVLQECRDEVRTIMSITTSSDCTTRTIHMSSIRQKCPTLTSTMQEALRLHSVGIQVRQVMQDTILDDKYLLKKDAVVLMPSQVVHTDPMVWGPSVSNFDQNRFKKNTKPVKAVKKTSPHAFRSFGGGTTLCPGRHFATTEILAMAAMMIMRYDLIPPAGEWIAPKTENTNVVAGMMTPDTDIEVDIISRQGCQDGTWHFDFADSDMVFAVAAEDKNH
ncbi:MAG: hypothetical protein LQ350_005008 [Teloschistes chrysophthalmus]|nr:MAG: hypothetical protein LQ350_005008 [Niorma chrysophthalma]